MRLWRPFVVLVALAGLAGSGLAACGDDGGAASSPTSSSSTLAAPTSGSTSTAPPFAGDMPTDPPRDPLRGDPADGHPLLPDATTVEYQPGLYLYLAEPASCGGPGSPTVVTSNASLAEGLAARDLTVALVEVRTPGNSGLQLGPEIFEAFQYSVHDLGVAVRWLHANAPELCVDPQAIAAAGYSFSAISALSLAYTAGELGPGEEVAIGGIEGSATADASFLPVPPELTEASADVDAVVSFSGFALAETIDPGEPPAVLFHGRDDATIPFALAEETCRQAVAVGVVCELVAHDSGHGMADDLDAALDRAVLFLQGVLPGSSSG